MGPDLNVEDELIGQLSSGEAPQQREQHLQNDSPLKGPFRAGGEG